MNEMDMSANSVIVIKKFCELCDELFSACQLRKCLFDENPLVSELTRPRHQHFFYMLQNILQENWVHKLARLHDPAVQNSAINLSIPYIVEFGNWPPDIKSKLARLQDEMDALSKPLRFARNKAIAHNDLVTLLSDNSLGAFESGQDDKYFRALWEFASVVCMGVGIDHFDYTGLVQNDVEIFMHDFVRGLKMSV